MEAHTNNEWPLGFECWWPQPTKIEERSDICDRFISEWKYDQLPVVLDTMENTFEKTFASWPERYYVFYQNKVAFIAMPHGDYYTVEDVRDYLNTIVEQPAQGADSSTSPVTSS